MGIDPGLENTGWGVIEIKSERANGFELVGFGVIKTKVSTEGVMRLRSIFEEIDILIEKYDPVMVALERLFFAKNAKSAIKVAEAIGAIKVCTARRDKEFREYTPLEVKMALVGYGRAEKEQVEAMVRNMLELSEVIKPDHASDAVAVALTAGFARKGE